MLCGQRKVHDPFLVASPIFSEWLLWHHSKEQECIPVGCVPPAAMAVSPATHVPCHACLPAKHVPPAMHAPLLCTPPCHTPPYHAHPPAMHAPLPHMPPGHACPLPCMPPPPCRQNSWHTLVKALPCRNFVAGGKKGKLWHIWKFTKLRQQRRQRTCK